MARHTGFCYSFHCIGRGDQGRLWRIVPVGGGKVGGLTVGHGEDMMGGHAAVQLESRLQVRLDELCRGVMRNSVVVDKGCR